MLIEVVCYTIEDVFRARKAGATELNFALIPAQAVRHRTMVLSNKAPNLTILILW